MSRLLTAPTASATSTTCGVLKAVIILACLSATVLIPGKLQAKPEFSGTTLSLPEVQVGDEIWGLTLELTDPNTLTFQLDLQNIDLLAEQAQAACMDPYFSFTQNQLILPVLEVGSARYQVILDLIDVGQGLFQVNPASPLLVDSANGFAPAFTVWQSGERIEIEWGSPVDTVDNYIVWYTPYQSGEVLSSQSFGTLTGIGADLPPGADFCLAVSGTGPDGETDLSDFQRFTNTEIPYTSFETDNPVLPMLLLPTADEQLAMALMVDEGDSGKPYGAVFENSDSQQSLLMAFNPDTGLLTRLTMGNVVFHFSNYTATTVDVIRSLPDDEPLVLPNLPLSNHAVSIIEGLVDEFEAPAPNPLVDPAQPDAASLQQAYWSKLGLELGADILLAMRSVVLFPVDSNEQALIDQVQVLVDGFRGDIFKTAIGEDSTTAREHAQAFLDSAVEGFDCNGETGFGCAAYGINQADFGLFSSLYSDTITGHMERLLNAVSDAAEQRMLLNQDCEVIENAEEKQACLDLQGNPEPGEQEERLDINDTQDQGLADEEAKLAERFAAVEDGVNIAEPETLMLLNELSFDYGQYIGQRIWITGYYGDPSYSEEGYGYLLNSPTLLDDDRELPHHSHAMLDGNLPPQDWNRAEVMIYGEIKDFATESGLFTLDPTPLITVIDAVQISPPVAIGEPGSQVLADGPQFMEIQGTQASACDRVVIISGGVDVKNNHPRYRQAVAAIYTKSKALGFTDAQIEVFYFDGSAINVGGSNVVDEAANKQKILDHLAALKDAMDPSCTLSIFVSDHGTGFETGDSYGGQRPVFSGTEFEQGMTYPENTFMFNAMPKVYRATGGVELNGMRYFMAKDEFGDQKIRIYKLNGGSATYVGTDTNGDGRVTEGEINQDLDGDPNRTTWLVVAALEARLGDLQYRQNNWDSDRDGTIDTRLRWDGMRYVAERLVGEEWREMGRDTNEDYKIDATDGGIDWNLDGDKNDHVGFHEGINLFGREVLWDDELAGALQTLYESGKHNNIFMVSCFSGGFVLNLQNYVENIFTGSKEDKPHTSRDGGTGQRIHDTNGFLNNWNGIDTPSWLHGEQGASEADVGVGSPNMYRRGGVEKFESNSVFQEVESGEYLVKLDLPFQVLDNVYDFEFIYGLQVPRWAAEDFEVLDGLGGLEVGPIPGGFRAFDVVGIEDGLTFRVKAPAGLDMMRIELTDINHSRLGYIMAMPGTVELPAVEINPCVQQEYMVYYDGGVLVPDPFVFGCDGSAWLGSPTTNGGPYLGEWHESSGWLMTSFGGGLTFFNGWSPMLPNVCYTGIEWEHLGFAGTNAMICPLGGMPELELQNGKFNVEVQWSDPPGGGQADAIPFSETAGGFYFFSPENTEMIVQVLNGCAINGNYWVFTAALTDVEYTITVTDTGTSHQRQYFNPLGMPSQLVQDTTAFATCE